MRVHPFTGRDLLDRPSRLWVGLDLVVRAPHEGEVTRLLIRTRGAWSHRWVGRLIQPALEPVHFVMERRMLLGIRARAEGRDDSAHRSLPHGAVRLAAAER